MSRVSVKSAFSAQRSLESLTSLGPKLLAMSLDSARDFMQQTAGILAPSMPPLWKLRPKGMCEIPETECPPHCVCEMTWEAGRGETLHCSIRVTNASKSAQTFQLQATPFFGAPTSPPTISLSPTSLTLPAGQSGVVTASFTVTPEFAPGRYDAEILVKGAYEQCVCVTLKVQSEQHCTCEVVQGDPPVRLRAHHWHDHFQCAEPCAAPMPRKAGADTGAGSIKEEREPR